MGNSILTNGGASFISAQMDKSRAEQIRAQTQLASGLRNPDPANNPSGTAISLKLSADITVAKAIQDMAVQGGSMVSLAVGVLNNTASVLNRMKELATLATSATISSADRANIAAEFVNLQSQLDTNAATKFAGANILDGTFTSGEIQIGTGTSIDEKIALNWDATYSIKGADRGVDAGSINLSDTAGASAAITAIDTALTAVLTALANVSAVKLRLDVANSNMDTIVQNYELALSTYRDVNVTEALANAQRAQALVDAGSSALQQNVNMFTSLSRMIQGALR
jgi:flagellin